MNFTEKEFINGVYKFNIFNQNLFYIDINTNLIFDNEVKANNIISFNFQNDFIEFYNTNKITTILNLKSKKVDFVNGAIINDSKSDKDFLVSNYQNGQYEITSYNIIDNHFNKIKKLQTKINFGSSIRYLDYFIFQNNIQGISTLSLLTGEYTWQTNLSTYCTIRKVLGVCGQNLWVTTEDRLPDSDSNKLIALSINDGAILQVTDHNYTFASFWVELLINEEKIVSIRGDAKNPTHLYEYCAKTGNILRNQTIDSLEVNGFSIICATVKEKLIYFTATDHTQIVANHVGVLDFETLEVLWFEKVNPGNLKLEPPQVAGNKIYVLGGDGTLHIFEKEI